MKKFLGFCSMTTLALAASFLTSCCCERNPCCDSCPPKPRCCEAKPCCPIPTGQHCENQYYDNSGCY